MANPHSNEVSLEQAFREAVGALGEATVRERLLQARVFELENRIRAFEQKDEAS